MPACRSLLALLVLALSVGAVARGELRAGAAVVDVTPIGLPVLVNGGMLTRSIGTVKTPLHARALVLDDGKERVAIVVVDSCMIPRQLLDEAKAAASGRTKIRPERMLISATHTHSAPSSMGCLGTDVDPNYVPYLREKLAEAIASAEKNLEPARIGFGSVDAAEFTAPRRWIRRSDRVAEDPFGNPTVRANMHAGGDWDDAVGEAGPEDPELSLIAVQTSDGRPLAILANFSMHYFGDEALSADYFGLFSEGLKTRLAAVAPADQPPFVAMMSHGCSGDIWRRDYTKPKDEQLAGRSIDEYSQALVDRALSAYEQIEYAGDPTIAMAEERMNLRYRVPDKQRLEWAQRVVAEIGDRPPKDTREVYAREQILLHERQSTEVVVQALRIGDIAIATTPNETYALSGLKLKLQSPLANTMVIELANGGDGYIPPPEQHLLGGYNTWAARSAGLEVEAEPKIVEAALRLLEQVADEPRKQFVQSRGPAAEAVFALKPTAYWRLDEFAGPRAIDAAKNGDAIYEPGVVFFLEGPKPDVFCREGEKNRAAHFAGGRLNARVPGIDDRYTLSLWIWNGMPDGARDVSGWFLGRGQDYAGAGDAESFGLGGAGEGQGKLIYRGSGEASETLFGTSRVERWTWNHVALVRDGRQIRVYLNGDLQPEIEATLEREGPIVDQFFFGGRCDRETNWEGRLDEIAAFDRILTPEEIATLAGD
ncbi:MAG TPA: LamG-like jellyroll fold domain-containing protein [Pirellulaceae bacterium]|jgi:hypothetical protein|nr:LamG-like jellyroll fold domain-containing protein [Pirellulaceae bacterium]